MVVRRGFFQRAGTVTAANTDQNIPVTVKIVTDDVLIGLTLSVGVTDVRQVRVIEEAAVIAGRGTGNIGYDTSLANSSALVAVSLRSKRHTWPPVSAA